MGIEVERTLVEFGGHRPRPIGVTLPIAWLRYWGLKKGQKVVILCNSVLVLIPPGHPKRDKIKTLLKERLIDAI